MQTHCLHVQYIYYTYMLSLYIHIPFCAYKCKYCSFSVVQEEHLDDTQRADLKSTYMKHLLEELEAYHTIHWSQQIKTIYIGWGTPLQIWKENLYIIIDTILEKRDCEFLEELTVEFNPDPIPEVLGVMKEMSERYDKLYRLRYSIGIQTFNDTILKDTKRQYTFESVQTFLRWLRDVKTHTTSFSLDFIAFGAEEADEHGYYLRNDEKLKFFQAVARSGIIDSYSLYTLEIYPWSEWWNEANHELNADRKAQSTYGDEEWIIDEFEGLRKMIEPLWYKRVEISTFAKMWKQSIHNTVYWNRGEYLWIGMWAASFVDGKRWKNTRSFQKYCNSETRVDQTSIEELSPKEALREEAMLKLRTWWISSLEAYAELLADDREDTMQELIQEQCVVLVWDSVQLTSRGYTLYTYIVQQLFTPPQ